MIHAFCAPSEQLQETSCFSNQASLGLLMVMSSEAAHRPGTGSMAAAWGADGQLPPSLDRDHEPTQRCAGAPNGPQLLQGLQHLTLLLPAPLSAL